MRLEDILSGAAGKVRKTEESPPRYSLVDILRIVTGYSQANASNAHLRVQRIHQLEEFERVKFPGRGQRLTQVCTADEAQQMLARLGGTSAAEFRADGKTGKRTRGPKHDDLYVMKYSFDDTAVKIGRSDNVKRRKRELEAGQNFFVEVVAVFPGKGCFEKEVHRNLQDYRSTSGAGREWFNICAEDAAVICSNTLKEVIQACALNSPEGQCLVLSKRAEVAEDAPDP